jgi:hypothetical protein
LQDVRGENSAARRIQEMQMKETRKPVRKPRNPAVTKPAAKPVPAKGKTAVRKKAVQVLPVATQPSPGDDREERIRMAAYFRAERRGFVRGYELEDWLAAEAEVSAVSAFPRGARPLSGQGRRVKDRKV